MTGLISARDAMQAAQDAGDQADYEAARFWLDFARELREEFFARISYEAIVKPLPSMIMTRNVNAPAPDVLAGTDRPREQPHSGMPSPSTADTVISVPVGKPFDGDGTRCRHCGYFLKRISAESAGRDDSKSFYVHTRTGQQVCPVGYPARGDDDTMVHTFAEPE